MARKSPAAKQRRKKGSSLVARFERARRELAKGNAKTALKEAILCQREEPSPGHGQLVEEAYAGRVEQLHRKKMLPEARDVLARLMALKPVTPEIQQRIPRLQVLVGHSGVDSNEVFDSDPALLVDQVDCCMLDAREVVPHYREIPQHIHSVHEALALVEQGDDEEAAVVLRSIPRNSPLSDWKLFARGLSAFYRVIQEGTGREGIGREKVAQERMEANWRLLDPERPAYRLTRILLVAGGVLRQEDVPMDGCGDLSGSLKQLDRLLQIDPVADLLKRIADRWQEEDLHTFFKDLQILRMRYAKTHGEALETIVEFVWKQAAREGDRHLFEELIRVGPPPADDPHWHRAKALLSEHKNQPEANPVESHWQAYAEDLLSSGAFREEDRPIAAAMVYAHLAECFIEYGEACVPPGPRFEPPSPEDAEEASAFFEQAVDFYEQSLRRCPKLHEAAWGLAMWHEKMGAPEKSAAVLEEFVRHEPNDHDAGMWDVRRWLAAHYISHDDPGRSERHAAAAAKIKPRDPRTIALLWNQRVTMVRCLAKKRQFGAARQELEMAAKSAPPDIEPYRIDTLRAALELKAKNTEAAQRYLNAALLAVDGPAPVWLQMSHVAARYRLSREIKKDFSKHFKEAIQEKVTSRTAGSLARLLAIFQLAKINYTGRATQERLVLGYLKRAGRVQWEEQDLLRVCEWLEMLPKQKELRERLVAKGLAKFPESAVFHLLTGKIEMDWGPMACDFDRAEHHLNRFLELARGATSQPQGGQLQATLLEKAQIEDAQRLLGLLRDTKERLASPTSSPFFMEEDDDDYDYEEECDCEECRRYRELSQPSGKVDIPAFLDELKRTMPKPLLRQLEKAAQAAGTDLADMMKQILAERDLDEAEDAEETAPARRRTGPFRRFWKGRRTTTT